MSLLKYSKKLNKHLEKQNLHGVDKYVNKINMLTGGDCDMVKNIKIIELVAYVGDTKYIMEKLGEGAYGTVYRLGDTDVVLKIFKGDKQIDFDKILTKYRDIGQIVPTIKTCAVDSKQRILFMLNAGISFDDFVKVVQGSMYMNTITIDIRIMLIKFVNDTMKLNKKYVHLDIKKENIMFKENKTGWEIIFIDMDDVCLRSEATTCKSSYTWPIMPLEFKPSDTINFIAMGYVIMNVITLDNVSFPLSINVDNISIYISNNLYGNSNEHFKNAYDAFQKNILNKLKNVKNPVNVDKITKVMELFKLMYKPELKKRDYKKVTQLIEGIYTEKK